MLTLMFLAKTLIDFFIVVFQLRIWMEWACCDYNNPFSQWIIVITQSVVNLLKKVIPRIGFLNNVFIILVFFLSSIKFPLLTLIELKTPVFNLDYFLIGILVFLKSFGKLIFWIINIRLLVNWISKKRSSIDLVLYQLSESVMCPVRNTLPIKSIDLSEIIVIFILYIMNYLGIYFFSEVWNKI